MAGDVLETMRPSACQNLHKVGANRDMRPARGGCTSIAAAASANDAPQRAHRPLPGMFSNWQLGHCMANAEPTADTAGGIDSENYILRLKRHEPTRVNDNGGRLYASALFAPLRSTRFSSAATPRV